MMQWGAGCRVAALSCAVIAGCAISADSVSDATVEVYKSAGGRQCETEGGISVGTMRAELDARRIAVASTACGVVSGMQFIDVCGAYDGSINVYIISEADLERARELGFERTAGLPRDHDGRTWRRVDCPGEPGELLERARHQ